MSTIRSQGTSRTAKTKSTEHSESAILIQNERKNETIMNTLLTKKSSIETSSKFRDLISNIKILKSENSQVTVNNNIADGPSGDTQNGTLFTDKFFTVSLIDLYKEQEFKKKIDNKTSSVISKIKSKVYFKDYETKENDTREESAKNEITYYVRNLYKVFKYIHRIIKKEIITETEFSTSGSTDGIYSFEEL